MPNIVLVSSVFTGIASQIATFVNGAGLSESASLVVLGLTLSSAAFFVRRHGAWKFARQAQETMPMAADTSPVAHRS
jgi:hypothetical protein